MSEGREPIRSYQRIFRPERRIYQIEGRTLPVPGGVPLRWLAYLTAALLAVLALGSKPTVVAIALAAGAALAGYRAGGGAAALVASAAALAGCILLGWALGLLDWPLRLVVVPAAIATLATQATPDGRRADRFAISWAALRLKPGRRSLGRALPLVGRAHRRGGEVWVAPDERSPSLRRARVRGAALVFFSAPVALRRVGLRRRRLRAQPGQGESGTGRVVLGEGELLEVRP